MDQGIVKLEAASAQTEAQRLDVLVSGMSCAGCVRRVERAVAAVPGVREVMVNLATERASITPGEGFRLSDLTQALDAAGYPVAEEAIDLAVSGMSCASCSGRVERALLGMPGVVSAEVNLASERARVHVATGTASAGQLIAAVRAAGYQASLPVSAGETVTARPAWADRDGLAAAMACALALPLLLPMLAMPFGVNVALPGWAQLALASVCRSCSAPVLPRCLARAAGRDRQHGSAGGARHHGRLRAEPVGADGPRRTFVFRGVGGGDRARAAR